MGAIFHRSIMNAERGLLVFVLKTFLAFAKVRQ